MEPIMLTITNASSSKIRVPSPRTSQGETKNLTPVKVLVVDDQRLIREVLCDLVRQLKDNAIVMEAADGHQAMQFVAEQDNFGLVLLDMNLPDQDGFTVLNRILAHHPETPIITLFDQPDRATTVKALNLGALGVIPKSEKRQIILGALRIVLAGGIYIPREILRQKQSEPKAANFHLTNRQFDIMALMMQGKSNKAICRSLQLALPTVKNHVTAILAALNVRNRTEAVIAAGEQGWPLPSSNRSRQTLQGSLATVTPLTLYLPAPKASSRQ
jgi:DNA-binding NarL/FixJ family response regulator